MTSQFLKVAHKLNNLGILVSGFAFTNTDFCCSKDSDCRLEKSVGAVKVVPDLQVSALHLIHHSIESKD